MTSAANIYYSTGNVGLGINPPNCLLQMHKTGNNKEFMIRFTYESTSAGVSYGLSLFKTDSHDLFSIVYENARLVFFTRNSVLMIILANGYVYVGSQGPNNIFQIRWWTVMDQDCLVTVKKCY